MAAAMQSSGAAQTGCVCSDLPQSPPLPIASTQLSLPTAAGPHGQGSRVLVDMGTGNAATGQCQRPTPTVNRTYHRVCQSS